MSPSRSARPRSAACATGRRLSPNFTIIYEDFDFPVGYSMLVVVYIVLLYEFRKEIHVYFYLALMRRPAEVGR